VAVKAGYADVWEDLSPYTKDWIIATWETIEVLESAAIESSKPSD
jgi:hypothetical protein